MSGPSSCRFSVFLSLVTLCVLQGVRAATPTPTSSATLPSLTISATLSLVPAPTKTPTPTDPQSATITKELPTPTATQSETYIRTPTAPSRTPRASLTATLTLNVPTATVVLPTATVVPPTATATQVGPTPTVPPVPSRTPTTTITPGPTPTLPPSRTTTLSTTASPPPRPPSSTPTALPPSRTRTATPTLPTPTGTASLTGGFAGAPTSTATVVERQTPTRTAPPPPPGASTATLPAVLVITPSTLIKIPPRACFDLSVGEVYPSGSPTCTTKRESVLSFTTEGGLLAPYGSTALCVYSTAVSSLADLPDKKPSPSECDGGSTYEIKRNLAGRGVYYTAPGPQRVSKLYIQSTAVSEVQFMYAAVAGERGLAPVDPGDDDDGGVAAWVWVLVALGAVALIGGIAYLWKRSVHGHHVHFKDFPVEMLDRDEEIVGWYKAQGDEPAMK